MGAGEEGCRFLLANEDGRPWSCRAPTDRGASYCPRHRALCLVAPKSAEGTRLARALERDATTALFPHNRHAHLFVGPAPDPDEVDDPRDLVALLDVVPERHDDESI